MILCLFVMLSVWEMGDFRGCVSSLMGMNVNFEYNLV